MVVLPETGLFHLFRVGLRLLGRMAITVDGEAVRRFLSILPTAVSGQWSRNRFGQEFSTR